MKYKILVTDCGHEKIYSLEKVRYLADKILELGNGVNFSYIGCKLTFFCDYIDQARNISILLGNLGYSSFYYFNEEIKC